MNCIPRILLGFSLLLSIVGAGRANAVPGVFNVLDYGAKGDSVTLDTRAIQTAVDACGKTGGEVIFPCGVFRSGTIVMRSGVTLRLMPGAVLFGSADLADYPEHIPAIRSYTDSYVRRSLIYAEGLSNIGICGEGTINGNGNDPAFKKDDYLSRPYVIRCISCRDVRISGITLQNSPMWMQHYLACDNLFVSGIRVYNHGNRNNDMIDLDGCHTVVMSDCISDTDDDGITIKSTTPRLSEHIAIANCTVSSHCNAIKMGTESVGGFRNISISNCVVKPSEDPGLVYGVRDGISGIALEIVDGGVMENVTISNISIDRVSTPIFVRLGNRGRKYTPDAPQPGAGVLRNVLISGVIARGTNATSSITGIPDHPVENVTLRDIRLISTGGAGVDVFRAPVPENEKKYPEAAMFGTRLPAYGMYIRHAKGVTLDGVVCLLDSSDARPAIFCEDVERLDVTGFTADPPSQGPLVFLKATRDAFFHDCRALKGTTSFVRVEGADSKHITLKGNDLRNTLKKVESGQDVGKGEIFIGD